MSDTSVAGNTDASRSNDIAKSQSALPRQKKTRSSGSEQSITRILDATLEAASRQGLSSLSMSDVCRVAGVARGTLYRYFPSKEALLESLGQRTRQQTGKGIREAAASANTGTEALVAVIEFLKNFAEETKSPAMLEVEPLFFMTFIRRHRDYYSQVMSEALVLFFDDLDRSLGFKVDRKLTSEIIFRLQLSYMFVPDDRSSEQLMEAIISVLEKMLSQD